MKNVENSNTIKEIFFVVTNLTIWFADSSLEIAKIIKHDSRFIPATKI